MRKTVIRPCAICGGHDADVLHHQTFASYDASPLPTSYDVVACTNCGFSYADTPASQADYDQYYRDYSKYEDEQVSSGTGLQSWELVRFNKTANDIVRIIPDRTSSILDVGCAGGGLLLELERAGYRNLSGMDHSVACVKCVSEKGFPTYTGGITALPDALYKHKFDGVILSHVLEHLKDLNGTLQHCAQLLSEGGVLYIETPDAASYPEFTIVPYYFFDCEHINHFSLRSLRNLGEKYGLAYIDGKHKSYYASTTTLYPAVWAAFRRNASTLPRVPEHDDAARDGIKKHIELSLSAAAMPEVERFAAQHIPIIVWGAGSFAQRLLENSPLARCSIRYFIDNDIRKMGKCINGIHIRLPSEIDSQNTPIVICSALFNYDILIQIKAMGLANPLIQLGSHAHVGRL